jgi:hypothetical protein
MSSSQTKRPLEKEVAVTMSQSVNRMRGMISGLKMPRSLTLRMRNHQMMSKLKKKERMTPKAPEGIETSH